MGLPGPPEQKRPKKETHFPWGRDPRRVTWPYEATSFPSSCPGRRYLRSFSRRSKMEISPSGRCLRTSFDRLCGCAWCTYQLNNGPLQKQSTLPWKSTSINLRRNWKKVEIPSGNMASTLPQKWATKKHEIEGGMPANCLFDFLPKHVYPNYVFWGIFVFFEFKVTC